MKTGAGRAVKDVDRILQENVRGTREYLYEWLKSELGLIPGDMRLLGSAGRRKPGSYSGDIVIAVDATRLSKRFRSTGKDLLNDIALVFPVDYVYIGASMISVAWPIQDVTGRQHHKFVQVDLMLVENNALDFARWAMSSPNEGESKYKGLYRNNGLLSAISFYAGREVLARDSDGNPAMWNRHLIDQKKGLFFGVQSCVSPKTGAMIKTRSYLSKRLVTHDPEIAIEILLGPEFQLADTRTFESVFAAINSPQFIHKERRDDILKLSAQNLIECKAPLPEELREYA